MCYPYFFLFGEATIAFILIVTNWSRIVIFIYTNSFLVYTNCAYRQVDHGFLCIIAFNRKIYS